MIEIVDCEQNSPEWLQARLGLPTASEFKTIIGIKKDAREKVTRRDYLYKLAGEIITGKPANNYSNEYMERGHEMEPEAREIYAFLTGVELQRVGFVRNGPKGASPDSFVGDSGILEIKTKFPSYIVDLILKDEFPPGHKAQCQGAIWVCEREWIDIACYWPDMPMFRKRAYRDEKFIAELSAEVDRFNAELADTVEIVRRYGNMREAA